MSMSQRTLTSIALFVAITLFVYVFTTTGNALAICSVDKLPDFPGRSAFNEEEIARIAKTSPAYVKLVAAIGMVEGYGPDDLALSARPHTDFGAMDNPLFQPYDSSIAALIAGYDVEFESNPGPVRILSSWSINREFKQTIKLWIQLNDVVAFADFTSANCLELSSPIYVWSRNATNAMSSKRVRDAHSIGYEFYLPNIPDNYSPELMLLNEGYDGFTNILTDTYEIDFTIFDVSSLLDGAQGTITPELTRLLDDYDQERDIVGLSNCSYPSSPPSDSPIVTEKISALFQEEFNIPLESIWLQGCLFEEAEETLQTGEVRLAVRRIR